MRSFVALIRRESPAELAVSQNGLHLASRDERQSETWARRMFWTVMIFGAGLILNGLWDHMDRRTETIPFVQPIEVHEDGRMVLLAPSKPLKDYVIPAPAIQFLLGRLVVDLQRVSADIVVNEDSARNVKAALCSEATQIMRNPAERTAAVIIVDLESVHQGASAKTWHAEWRERWYDARQLPKGQHAFRADLTLAPRQMDWQRPQTLEITRRFPLGLCLHTVTIYEVGSR